MRKIKKNPMQCGGYPTAIQQVCLSCLTEAFQPLTGFLDSDGLMLEHASVPHCCGSVVDSLVASECLSPQLRVCILGRIELLSLCSLDCSSVLS